MPEGRASETPKGRAPETPGERASETPGERASETPEWRAAELPKGRASETPESCRAAELPVEEHEVPAGVKRRIAEGGTGEGAEREVRTRRGL